MACGKPISSFSIFMAIFMVVFVSVVHSSRTRELLSPTHSHSLSLSLKFCLLVLIVASSGLQGGVPADHKAIPTQVLKERLQLLAIIKISTRSKRKRYTFLRPFFYRFTLEWVLFIYLLIFLISFLYCQAYSFNG